MFVRRSEQLNGSCNAETSPEEIQVNHESVDCFQQDNENHVKQEEQKPKLVEDGYLNSSDIQQSIEEETKKENIEEVFDGKTEVDVDMVDEKPAEITSATTKALLKMDSEGSEKKKLKRSGKTSMAFKRKKLNKRLARLLTPKSALILLHELKPNCSYKVQEQPSSIPPSFYAQVIHNDVVIGVGQGLSKSNAKNSAAENAIKAIVSKTMSQQMAKTDCETNSVEMNVDEVEDTPENLPWAGLASFAIYKMFSDWQAQGTDILSRSVSKHKHKSSSISTFSTKKELPSNAIELHPAVVLNIMRPGLTAVEVERENGPKCRVKMEYSIDGKVFTGVGGNKKDAKREAAKAVLKGLYGLTYPQ